MCVPPSPLSPLTHSPYPNNLGDVDEEHARALEEQWIDALGSGGGSGSASAESDSRARAVLNGIINGFFFPLLPFFFLRAPKPAAFWDNGHALETSESTVFSCVFFSSVFLLLCCFSRSRVNADVLVLADDVCRWAWSWVSS